jgi:hypothetical protein
MPTAFVVVKWMSLVGVGAFVLLALSLLKSHPPQLERAARKALNGLSCAALYFVVTRQNRMPYIYIIVFITLLQISLDVQHWRASRARKAAQRI